MAVAIEAPPRTFSFANLGTETIPSTWDHPRRLNDQAQRIEARFRLFCTWRTDLFDSGTPVHWRRELFDLIEATPNLDWLLPTKHIGYAQSLYAEAYLDSSRKWPSNIWIGAIIRNQHEADRDIPKLLAMPSARRLLFMAPLLGPVDLLAQGDPLCRCDGCLSMANRYPDSPGLQRIDGVIVVTDRRNGATS